MSICKSKFPPNSVDSSPSIVLITRSKQLNYLNNRKNEPVWTLKSNFICFFPLPLYFDQINPPTLKEKQCNQDEKAILVSS